MNYGLIAVLLQGIQQPIYVAPAKRQLLSRFALRDQFLSSFLERH